MAGLAFRQARADSAGQGYRRFCGQEVFHESGLVVSAPALVIAPQRWGGLLRVEPLLARQELEQKFHQPDQRNAVRPAHAPMQPFAPAHEPGEWSNGESAGCLSRDRKSTRLNSSHL